MKKYNSMLLVTVALFALLGVWVLPSLQGQTPVAFSSFRYTGGDSAAETRVPHPGKFTNPILPGMYPDPSVVRVRNDYYLVNSTFCWYPGVPIFHSRDLVHWRQIAYVLNRPSQLDLDHLQMSQGIFAPTLRYHDGVFYMITTLVGGIGTFYVTAKDPSGPWSDPIRVPDLAGIDPSFFFDDDGSVYIVHNARPRENILYDEQRLIWLVPFDLSTGRISGDRILLVNGGPDLSLKPRWIEGSHIYKRNGFYYLFAAIGGTGPDHSEIVFRSKTVRGPYVPNPDNPVLTQRNLRADRPHPVDATGHVDLVETPGGAWWAVFLGVQPYSPGLYNTGRETFLLPVSWHNDWPTILAAGTPVPLLTEKPDVEDKREDGNRAINFFDKGQLRLGWETIRTPNPPCWTVGRQTGVLLLRPGSDDLTSRGHPCVLARRQQQSRFSSSIDMDLASISFGVDAGLAVFQNEHSFYFLGVTVDAAHGCRIFVEKGTGTNELPAEITTAGASLKHCEEKIRLGIDGTGPSITFWYREAGERLNVLVPHADATILSTAKAGGFLGTFLGPFAGLEGHPSSIHGPGRAGRK